MKTENIVLALFFANEDNIVYESTKYSEEFSEERRDALKMLSFRFLGPVFLTAASGVGNNWKIDFIESALSLYQQQLDETAILQSFFTINSSVKTEIGVTNLFALISTPFTEDIKQITKAISNYIHPSIIQGKIVSESLLGRRFNFDRFIRSELNRGINLIEYSLGSTRKMYWEEKQRYYCVGVIERKKSEEKRISNLYTFDKDDPLRKEYLDFIPSYYVMSILPEYYENIISETLAIYDKKGVYPKIREIKLSYEEKKVIYLEEFIYTDEIFNSYGVILVQHHEVTEENNNISFFKKTLRLLLERKRSLTYVLDLLNPHFKHESWGTISNTDLEKISKMLDDENQ
jgi:hypothetical protein